MSVVDPHFAAAFVACSSVCQILEVMPQTDLIDELRFLMETQYDLFCHLIQGKHYGTDNLNTFITEAEDLARDIKKLKNQQ